MQWNNLFGREGRRLGLDPNLVSPLRFDGRRGSGESPDPPPPAYAPEDVFTDYFAAEDLALAEAAGVTSWAGRNGLSTLTQPGASNLRPTYRVDDGSGFSSVQLDGVDDYLLMDEEFWGALTGGLGTAAFVWESCGTTPLRFLWAIGASTTTARFAGVRIASNFEAYLRVQNSVSLNFESAGANDGGADFHLFEYAVNAEPTSVRYENTAGVGFDLSPTATPSDNSINQGAIGCLHRTTTFASFGSARLREVGFLNRPLTPTERSEYLAYLSTKYGY